MAAPDDRPVHLVTGGSGYFGGVLVRRLHERGVQVRVLDRIDAPDRPPAVELIQGDIRDPEVTARACAGAAVVHHNVAVVPLAKNRSEFWSVNRDGTRILLAAARVAGVRKVVHMSSSAVFGAPESNPVREDTMARPGEEYGRAKLAAEQLCRAAAEDGLDVTIIRPRTIIGPGRLGIMQILFEWVRSGRNLPVIGRGDNRYQFVDADDLADATLAAAELSGPDVFNVGADEFGTMHETLSGLLAHAGHGARVVHVPTWLALPPMRLTSALGLSPLGAYHALVYHRSLWFDTVHAHQRLSWQPRHSNVASFCRTYDWYLANREAILRGERGGSHHRSAVRQRVLRMVSWLL